MLLHNCIYHWPLSSGIQNTLPSLTSVTAWKLCRPLLSSMTLMQTGIFIDSPSGIHTPWEVLSRSQPKIILPRLILYLNLSPLWPRSFPYLPRLLWATHFVHSSKNACTKHFKLPQLCFLEDSGQDFVSLLTGIQRLYALRNRWEGGSQESPFPCLTPTPSR